MKERPILFSGAMIRAILAGTKTQTRRVVRIPDGWDVDTYGTGPTVGLWRPDDEDVPNRKIRCPYGAPGDRLWVRETFIERYFDDGSAAYRADWRPGVLDGIAIEPKWRPSIFMPRRLSRITLEIAGVRVERLQDISEEDARAEGVAAGTIPADEHGPVRVGFVLGHDDRRCVLYPDARRAFEVGWDTINGKRAPWASNPWVWCVSFRRAALAKDPAT